MKIISPKRLLTNVFHTVRNGDIFANSSLDLPFARTKTLDPRVSFTRVGSAANAATYVGSDGLIKSAVTNLVLRSEEFNDAAWTKTNSTVTTNAAIAPNGTLTAEKLITNSGASSGRVNVTITAVTDTPATLSCYAKQGETSVFNLFISDGVTGRSADFNLITGTVSGTPTAGMTASIQLVGDGWYRCVATVASPTGTTRGLRVVQTVVANDGTSGLFIWGAQFEQSATVGEYVPTTGTINSAPRFDHNPATGESLGLLVEEARTNLLLRSEEFNAVAWANVFTSESPNAAVAPNGTSTADKLIENSGAGFKSIEQQVAVSALTYTFSVYVKAVERSIVQLLWSGGASTDFANFNLATGTVTAGTYTSATITPAGSDWFRLSITSALAAGTFSGIISPQTNASATRAASYTGDGTSGLFLWGAQLEAGAFPTSYIPTTTATVTRAADVAQITGSNFSSWYNQTEGTVFGQFLQTASTNTQQGRVFSFNDGTNTNALEIYQTGASNPAAQITATTSQAQWTPSGFTVGTSIKEVLGYKLNNSNASFNGSAETLDTVCNIPTVTQARIGDRQDGVRALNGTIQRLTYWPTRLADTTLQQITQP